MRVTLNTDDLTVSDISLSDEYGAGGRADRGLRSRSCGQLDLAAIEAAFCDDATRDGLRDGVRAWGAGIPELEQA